MKSALPLKNILSELCTERSWFEGQYSDCRHASTEIEIIIPFILVYPVQEGAYFPQAQDSSKILVKLEKRN